MERNLELLRRVLDIKEKRAELHWSLFQKYSLPVISLTFNLPGGYLRYENWPLVSKVGRVAVEEMLAGRAVHYKYHQQITGPEHIWVANAKICELKKAAVEIEERHPLGKIFDIDIISGNGIHLSRSELGFPARRCLVCTDDAKACYRDQRHSFYSLSSKVKSIINAYKARGETHEPV